MAVMRNSIIFGGVNSADFGIYISGEGVFNAPKRAVEYVQVPGRSGAIAMDLGYYENIEVEYPAFNYEPEMADFIQALRSFRNAICSQTGYQRLSDTFHPDEYRMAVYSEGLEVDPVKFNTASEFTLKFNCKPQRYLLSGESAQSMGEWGDTETATGDIVTVENPDGVLAVKSLQVTLEPIQSGSGTPSPDNVRPISGRSEVVTSVSGKNLLDASGINGTSAGVAYTSDADGIVNINGTKSGSTYAPFSGTTVALKKGVTYTYLIRFLSGTIRNASDAIQSLQCYLTTTSNTNLTSVSGLNENATLRSVTFTPTEDVTVYPRFAWWSDGTIITNAKIEMQVEVGSSVTEWTPYRNGHTYTTSLGQTVYGGTLDVVSGELTVTHGYVDLGTLNWTLESGIFRLTTNIGAKVTTNTSAVASFVCSAYRTVSQSEMSGGVDKCIAGLNWDYGVRITDTSYADATAFKTAMDGVQLVYELATPTTVQLTPQEIELLTGTNHLWSGGEVTLEYGDNPAILYNPTPFDASPLLEVEGYGSIEFNGHTIDIDEGFYGIVDVADAGAIPTDTVLKTEMFNDGDTITIKPFTVNCHFGDDTYPFESPQVTNTSGIGTTAYASGSGTKNLHFKTTFAAITFASNTDYSSETKATLKATLNRSPLFSPPQAEDITININYTASTHTVSITVSSAPNPDQLITPEIFAFDNPSWNGATADSTKSTMTGTTYIDCDLGDAYKIEDGEYASLNSYIDLGSDLPTLASGANEVTFSNTVTSLKIIPRWWIL